MIDVNTEIATLGSEFNSRISELGFREELFMKYNLIKNKNGGLIEFP